MYATAVHESAHAVAAELLGFRVERVEVYVAADGAKCGVTVVSSSSPATGCPSSFLDISADALGDFLADPEQRDDMISAVRRMYPTDARITDRLAVNIAGYEAHRWVAPEKVVRFGARCDREIEDLLLDALSAMPPVRAQWLALGIARRIVTRHWETISSLALSILERGTVSGDEVRVIVHGEHLPTG